MNADGARAPRPAATPGALLAELSHIEPGAHTRLPLFFQKSLAELVLLAPAGVRRARPPASAGRSGHPHPAGVRIAHAQLPGWLKALHARLTRDVAQGTGPILPGRKVSASGACMVHPRPAQPPGTPGVPPLTLDASAWLARAGPGGAVSYLLHGDGDGRVRITSLTRRITRPGVQAARAQRPAHLAGIVADPAAPGRRRIRGRFLRDS
jgi:hypothetical protein